MKFMSLCCLMVTKRSETLLYVNEYTPVSQAVDRMWVAHIVDIFGNQSVCPSVANFHWKVYENSNNNNNSLMNRNNNNKKQP